MSEGEASAAWGAAVDTSQQFTGYNIRGVLNFLQKNWSSFERDKAAWEAEQAELKAYIAFLEGERRGQINLKRDLVRRIKMLEYALKQERAKYLALLNEKNGSSSSSSSTSTSTSTSSTSSSSSASDTDNTEASAMAKADSKMRPLSLSTAPRAAVKKSRHILRKYLNEIGITDSTIQAEAEAVRDAVDASLLFNADEDAAIRPQVRLLLKSDQNNNNNGNSKKKLESQVTVVEVRSNGSAFSDNNNNNNTTNNGNNNNNNSNNNNNNNSNSDNTSTNNKENGNANNTNTSQSKSSTTEKDDTHQSTTPVPVSVSVPEPVSIVVESLSVKPSVASEEEAIAEFDFLSSEDDGDSKPAATTTTSSSSSTATSSTSSTKSNKSEEADALAFLDETLDTAEKSTTASSSSSSSSTPSTPTKSTENPVADLSGLLPRKGGKVRGSTKLLAAAAAAMSGGDEEGDEISLEESKYDSNQLSKVMKHYERDKKVKGVRGRSPSKGKSSVMDMFGDEDDRSEKLSEAEVLGELADLSVAGDSEGSSTQKFDAESSSHHQWKPKYTLRGHFDAVRAIAFHDSEPAVLSASEDHTVKLWNFRNIPSSTKKTTHSPDLEPVYTYRGHTDVVTSIALSVRDGIFFTGGLDTTIRVWKLCPLTQPAYADFDPDMTVAVFNGHLDAVWGLAVHPVSDTLVSIGADRNCIVWNFRNIMSPLVRTISLDDVPTSITFIHSNLSRFAISTKSGKLFAYETSTGARALEFECSAEPSFINQVVSHPTLPLLITAHDDKTIQFFDASDGRCTHSMLAHLDAVSCLAIDHSGLFLLSGGHDSSLRLWDIAKKSCLQEISSHRKKYDEAVHSVIFHPFLPYVASGGADASVKIYV